MPKLPSPRPLITPRFFNEFIAVYAQWFVFTSVNILLSFSDDTVSFPVTCETIIDVLPFPEPFPDTEPIPFVLFGFLLIEFMYSSSNVPKDDNDSTLFSVTYL